MATKKKDELSFEEAILELSKITKALEEGNLPLLESVNMYETGMKLVKYCNECLEKAEAKITILAKGESGEIVEEDFSPANKE
jgi:exodeoxyribonuclease VII small subunit